MECALDEVKLHLPSSSFSFSLSLLVSKGEEEEIFTQAANNGTKSKFGGLYKGPQDENSVKFQIQPK